jgi:hypothetical protein
MPAEQLNALLFAKSQFPQPKAHFGRAIQTPDTHRGASHHPA